jgi:tRNA-dependent cyclodipeptide synthase
VQSNKEEKQKIRGLDPIRQSQSKTSSLIIAVSVGNKNFEREPLFTLVNAINELNDKLANKLTHCIVAVGDTLQRHNYRLDGKTSEEDALSSSEKAGDEWLARNTETLEKLKIGYTVTRWSEWLNDEAYFHAFSEISDLFNKDIEFKKAIEASVEEFSSRFTKRHEELELKGEINQIVLKQSCRDYLLEECAIIMKLWPKYKPNHCEYLLYPAKMTEALAYTYDKIEQKDLFKWNKFTIKGNIALVRSENKQERPFFPPELADCTSVTIMRSNLPKDKKLGAPPSYAYRATLFLEPNKNPVTDVSESTAKVVNFVQNNN